MATKKLSPVPCPVCSGFVSNVMVDEDAIANAKRVPVIVPAKCSNGHTVVLFVDRTCTVRDVEATGEAVQSEEEKGAIDKAKEWMDSF